MYAGDIAAAVGPARHDDRRHAVRRRPPDRARGDGVPGAGHRRRDRAEDARADQEKLGDRAAEAREGGSHVPRAHRRGDRPDDHLGHGRAAPGDHRRPPDARVQGRRQRGQAAGGLPRDDPRHGRGPRAGSSARPAGEGSTATSRSRSSPLEAGKGFVFENKIVGGVDAQGVHRRGREGRARRRCSPACWPAIRWWTSACAWSTARTTRWTRREMAFKIAGSMAFKEACRRPSRVLLEPIMSTSRWWCPRSTWATSSAI